MRIDPLIAYLVGILLIIAGVVFITYLDNLAQKKKRKTRRSLRVR